MDENLFLAKHLCSDPDISALLYKKFKAADSPDAVDIGEGEGSFQTKGSKAIGDFSTAEGSDTRTEAGYSHAEGYGTKTINDPVSGEAEFSHAEGYRTTTLGKASHAEGAYTVTNNPVEHAEGRGNKSNIASEEFGDAGNTIHSIGIGGTDAGEGRNAFEVMQNGDVYMIGVGEYDGTNPGEATRLQDILNEKPLIPITYAELKALRDAEKLTPGTQYRITDYRCATAKDYTQSTNHQFDIIVIADDESTINESARAINHPIDIEVINTDYGDSFKRDQTIDGTWYEQDYYYGWTSFNGYNHAFTKEEHPSIEDIVRMYGTVTPPKITSISSTTIDYFADSNLAAWKLKYCLNNDTNRFDWASNGAITIKRDYDTRIYKRFIDYDEVFEGEKYYAWGEISFSVFMGAYTKSETPNIGDTLYIKNLGSMVVYDFQLIDFNAAGTGVIYYMKDEWDNECPYDFKNIQFKRYYDYEWETYIDNILQNNQWCYTFCMLDKFDNTAHDVSVEQYKYKYDSSTFPTSNHNIILPYYDSAISSAASGYKQLLNNIVFVTDTDLCNVTSDYSYSDFTGYNSNSFGYNCWNNTLGYGCSNIIFGNNCYSNTFGTQCTFNTFGNDCTGNKILNKCKYNTFNNDCANNVLRSESSYNTFGNTCTNNDFFSKCAYNTFGNTCTNNFLKESCVHNTFGDYCLYNTLGSSCNYNEFGNNCQNNIFGSTDAINYCQYNTLGNTVRFCSIYGNATPTFSSPLKNIRIAQGTQGSRNSQLNISVATGLEYETYIGKNSSGNLVMKNLLDT